MALRNTRNDFANFANDSEWQKTLLKEARSILSTLLIADEKQRRESLKRRLNNN